MKIEQSYIDILLKPLQDNAVPNLSEYIEEIEVLGIQLESQDGRIDRKFETHLRYMSTKRLISNVNGLSDLKSLGFHLGTGGHIGIVGNIMIMKTEKEELVMPQNINIGSITSDKVQVGNNNSQVTNIHFQEIVEKVAASNDPEAKSILKSLLENSTVGSLLGAGASALIGLL
ncbi:hypothetical protein [uncultured Psychromonas sp.]|uniref:hypothetical protein n=1 Tax=uncultured Psychromonas sp. TaxID=173974 RepID=UPI0026091274|nr:hypothetical protein [uncultured Psychromonas sp.]